MARSNLVTLVFLLEIVKTVDFSETFAASDTKVGRCRVFKGIRLITVPNNALRQRDIRLK